MLTNINIRHFRSCHNVSLNNISDLLILIGRNGAGKTNILKAIDWACKFACNGLESPSSQSARIKNLEDGGVGMTFTADGMSYRYEVSKLTKLRTREQSHESVVSIDERIYLCTDGNSELIVHRAGESLQLTDPIARESFGLEISRTVPCILAINALFPEDNYFRKVSTSLLAFFSSVQYYPLHNFDEAYEEFLILGRNYVKWTSEKTSDSNTISSVLYKLIDLKIEQPETFSELIHLLGSNGLGLIENIEITEYPLKAESAVLIPSKENSFFYIIFVQSAKQGAQRFSVDELSFGTKRILFLLVAMLYDKASVALLEQPEDGVHIGLVDKLLPLFRAYSSRSQFVIASHSTTILNRAKPEEVYFISKDDGVTKARALTQDELCYAESYLRDEGSLSDFLGMIGND